MVLVGLLIRTRRWQIVLPSAVFVAMAFTAERNIVVASLILVPAMALAAHDLGSITGTWRRAIGPARVLAVLVVLGLVLTASELARPDTQLNGYPVQAVAYLQKPDLLQHRVVAPDYVGNYLEARYNG